MGFPGGAVVKEFPCQHRDTRDEGLIPGSGRSSRVGDGNPLQHSCLENSMDRGAWWATVHQGSQRVGQVNNLACTQANVKTKLYSEKS